MRFFRGKWAMGMVMVMLMEISRGVWYMRVHLEKMVRYR